MAKLYEVNHLLPSVFSGEAGERRTLKPGDAVTEAELRGLGFDGKNGNRSIEDLLTPRDGRFPAAITHLRGTADDEKVLAPPVVLSETPTGGQLDTAPKPEVADSNKK